MGKNPRSHYTIEICKWWQMNWKKKRLEIWDNSKANHCWIHFLKLLEDGNRERGSEFYQCHIDFEDIFLPTKFPSQPKGLNHLSGTQKSQLFSTRIVRATISAELPPLVRRLVLAIYVAYRTNIDPLLVNTGKIMPTNDMMHSLTVIPIISLDGDFHSKIFRQLSEPSGKIANTFYIEDSLVVTGKKSHMMSRETAETFFKECIFTDNMPSPLLLLLDSWPAIRAIWFIKFIKRSR